MQAIVQAIQFVLGKIVAALVWIGELFVKVFVALWHMLTDLFVWAFDGAMGIAVAALNAFDFSGLSANLGAWAGLPAQVIEVLSAIGITTALGLIVSALTIRLGLQLIPFTRLGS